jgi:hypothetical protein
MENMLPPAAIEAWEQLLALNLQGHKSEVADWLRSEDAAPVLKTMLVNVPCSQTLH